MGTSTRPSFGITLERHWSGPRLRLGRHRIHHGAAGCVIALSGAWYRRPAVIVLGALLTAHDWHDWRLWIPDAIRG